tara:strand:+ start:12826 stop:13212 length:387 start_codon:yes stop_codon:yes gene_type:complete
MIKEILSKLFTQKPKDLECAIDEDKVDCEHLDDDQDKAYVGVPAPVLNPLDDWFSSSYGCPSVVTEKQKDYMEQETEMKQQEQNSSFEPENIHQVMYEMATRSGATTVQLDPIGGSENFQGGSENVHR